MLLTRNGNKKMIADKIQSYFPKHTIYIEPFFGAGGIFFKKPKANTNILNDIDSDVFNLFQVIIDRKEELITTLKKMPLHMDLFKHWNKNKETDPIKKALRFILLSNYSYLGKGDTMRLSASKIEYHEKLESYIDKTHSLLSGCQFTNMDFRELLKSISYKQDGRNDEAKTFIYCDPPYHGTYDYKTGWSETDTRECFDVAFNSGFKAAMSEFDSELIMNEIKERGLNYYVIGERQSLKNRNTEILITNYEIQQTSLF